MRYLLAALLACLIGLPSLASAQVTTLNPSDKSANATLSNGNLTITTTLSAYSSARSTTAKSAGKLYAELKVDSVGGTTAFSWGLANASATLTGNIPGSNAGATDGIGYSLFDASFRLHQSQVFVSLGTISAGSYVGIAVDFVNKNIWIVGPSGVWDGVVGDDPATNTGGLNGASFYGPTTVYGTNLTTLLSSALYVMVSTYNNSQGTVNFGATAMHYTVPSGFSVWDSVAPSAGSGHQLLFSANDNHPPAANDAPARLYAIGNR